MIKKIITILLNFIISVLVFSLTILIIVSNTIFNKYYLIKQLEKNNFYQRSYSDIKKGFENYTMQSGLELTILENLVNFEKVKNDINLKIDAIFEKDDPVIETASIKEELNSRVEAEISKLNRVITDEEKKSINAYEDSIVEVYNSGILYGSQIHIEKDFLQKYIKIAVTVLIILIIVSLAINRKIYVFFDLIGISLLFSGVLNVAINLLFRNRISNILIMDAKFSVFLVNSLKDILSIILKIGILYIVVGGIFIIIKSLLYTKARKNV